MQTDTVLVLGDINADLTFSLAAFPREGDDSAAATVNWSSGGTGLNMAIALARLGAQPRLLGRIGSDPAATVALSEARAAGVDLRFLQHDATIATGLCGVLISPDGQRTFLSFRGANARCTAADLAAACAGCQAVLVSGYALLDEPQRATTLAVIALAAAQATPVVLDLCLPTIRRARSLVFELLPQIWLISMNEEELETLLPGMSISQAITRLRSAGANQVVIKRGPQGCCIADQHGRHDATPPPVAVVDTNGCGDAFTAACTWALLQGGTLSDAAALGNLLGALTATRSGAASAVPSTLDIRTHIGIQQSWLLASADLSAQ